MAAEDVPVAILEEILLRLPSSASLVRAALVSKLWGCIVSGPAFLRRYRKLHPSSPLLGLFSSYSPHCLPDLRLNASESDLDLKAVLRGGADLGLDGLEQGHGWRVRDDRNGHLLLRRRVRKSGGDSFTIYNPVSRRRFTIPAIRPHHPAGYFADCLLPHGDSFRVVSVQQHGGEIRAVEYDPGARRWCAHPWESPWPLYGPDELTPRGPMYAGAGLIFWRYIDALAIVLDCSSMHFSVCRIPTSWWYGIGEIQDGVGCIVCLDNIGDIEDDDDICYDSRVFRVGLLGRNTCGDITWEFSGKHIPMSEVLGEEPQGWPLFQVTNGLALISFHDQYHKFVIDLNKLSLHAKFYFHGRAYPHQMTWPPLGLPSLYHICKGALSSQQPAAALDDHLHEPFLGECHNSTCAQHQALPAKPRCEVSTSEVCRDEMIERRKSSVPPEPGCEGGVSSFRVDPPLVPAPCFPHMSPASNNHASTQFLDEATYTQKLKSKAMYTEKVKNSEEAPDMESDELDQTHSPVDGNQNLNQRHENLTADRQDFVLDTHPSEQKLIESYLKPHVVSGDKSCSFIHDSDVYAVHPADLTREYTAAVSSNNGHKVWYFFTAMRARGSRCKRKVDSGHGFWHTESKPQDVVSANRQRIGYRRYLKFARKDGNRRIKSKWVMVELGLHNDGRDKVTLCKVYLSLRKRKAAADETNDPAHHHRAHKMIRVVNSIEQHHAVGDLLI